MHRALPLLRFDRRQNVRVVLTIWPRWFYTKLHSNKYDNTQGAPLTRTLSP